MKDIRINAVLTFTTFLCLLLLSQCNNKDSKSSVTPFVREIPANLEQMHTSILPIRDSLKLDTLEKGYDSLEIRIWTYLMHKQQVIIIKNNKGSWSAQFIRFHPVLNDKMDSVRYFEKEIVQKDPKEPWNEFVSKLMSFHVLTLPDAEKLPHYEHPQDGLNLAIEIATPSLYRIYSYHEPGVNQNIPQAKDVVNILELIKQDFDIKMVNDR